MLDTTATLEPTEAETAGSDGCRAHSEWHRQPCTVRGQWFPSQAAAAAHFGVSPSAITTMYNRYGHLDFLALKTSRGRFSRTGCDLPRAGRDDLGVTKAGLPRQRRPNGTTPAYQAKTDRSAWRNQPCTVRGQWFPSQSAAAAHFGLNPSAVSQAFRRDGHLDKLGLPRGGQCVGNTHARAVPVVLGGASYRSKAEAARALGVSYSCLKRWLHPNASAAERELLARAVLAVAAQREEAARRAREAEDKALLDERRLGRNPRRSLW